MEDLTEENKSDDEIREKNLNEILSNKLNSNID